MKKLRYIPPRHYSEADQVRMIKDDLLRDAAHAEQQADQGPFYPDRGVTRESLLVYAQECREKAAKQFTSTQFIKGGV